MAYVSTDRQNPATTVIVSYSRGATEHCGALRIRVRKGSSVPGNGRRPNVRARRFPCQLAFLWWGAYAMNVGGSSIQRCGCDLWYRAVYFAGIARYFWAAFTGAAFANDFSSRAPCRNSSRRSFTASSGFVRSTLAIPRISDRNVCSATNPFGGFLE